MPKAKGVLAWHFLREDGKLNYLDKEPPPDGETLVHSGEIELCSSGLHASKSLWDALSYAPGHVLCRVRMGGIIKNGDDKLVASERTILWRLDAPTMDRVLRLWACWCVRNTKLEGGRTVWDLLTDPRSRNAVEVAERFANGYATKEELAAAGAAAWAAAGAAAAAAGYAARDAARAAARAAAGAAAWDAAWAAAGAAARAAARAAAGYAAWAAARDAARAAAGDAAGDAARAAAEYAAGYAAGYAATKQLLKMVNDEHKRQLKEKTNA